MTSPDVSVATRVQSQEPDLSVQQPTQFGDEDRTQQFECMSCGSLQETDTRQCTSCGGQLRAAAHRAHHVIREQIDGATEAPAVQPGMAAEANNAAGRGGEPAGPLPVSGDTSQRSPVRGGPEDPSATAPPAPTQRPQTVEGLSIRGEGAWSGAPESEDEELRRFGVRGGDHRLQGERPHPSALTDKGYS